MSNHASSQPVEITEIEEDPESQTKIMDSPDSEKQIPSMIDMADSEEDEDEEEDDTPPATNQVYIKQKSLQPQVQSVRASRSPPNQQFLQTFSTEHPRGVRVAVKRGSPQSEQQQHHVVISGQDANGAHIQKIILKNPPTNGQQQQQVLVTSGQMAQFIAQQTQGAQNNLTLQQVEGAHALIALQQQSSTPVSGVSKRAKYTDQGHPIAYSTANSQMTERSTGSPQLSMPQTQNASQSSDFSAPTYIDKQQKTGEISSFIHKINKMIDLAAKDEQYWTTDGKYALIHWNEDGRHFIIHEPDVFTRKLIPTHFRHQKLPSFIRQLNQYGFKKLNRMEHDNYIKYKSEYFEYYHEFFHRDKPEEWHKVKRRRNENHGNSQTNGNAMGGGSEVSNVNQISEKKISEAYIAGITAGQQEAARQIQTTPQTIIKQMSIQDNEEFQELKLQVHKLSAEQEYHSNQMTIMKNHNQVLTVNNHELKKENKGLKLQISNLWREVSEIKDILAKSQKDNAGGGKMENRDFNGSKSPKATTLAADLANVSGDELKGDNLQIVEE